jgi:hypothetical protein
LAARWKLRLAACVAGFAAAVALCVVFAPGWLVGGTRA